MYSLIKELKENQEDFEFYPTTDEMLKVVVDDIKANEIHRSPKLLDIGCGNCKILNHLKDCQYMVIEKAKTFIDRLPKQATFIGADFNENTLMDKEVDIIFCNPPYSEFVNWTIKILKESNAERNYLIIPQRWKDNEIIKQVIEDRKISFDILYTGDFLNAERQARAKVDIVCFKINNRNDAFDYWFNNNFQFKKIEKEEEKRKEKIQNEIMIKKDVISVLVENYNLELQQLQKNYYNLTELDPTIFNDLKIDLYNLKSFLREKIGNLKYVYWKELFDNFKDITNRLTQDRRRNLLNSIVSKSIIDFNKSNIYGIILFIIDYAKDSIEEQLKEVYVRMMNKTNCIKYKSNEKVFTDEDWRYKKNITHCKLDYRIVLNYEDENFINDLITVANTLGFSSDYYIYPKYRLYREKNKSFGNDIAYCKDGNILFDYKSYQNGNIHIRFGIDFMKRLNIEAGRIFGWVKNKEELKEELEDITDEDLKYFGCSTIALNVNNILLLN